MRIEKNRDRLVIKYGEKEVAFNGFRNGRKDVNVPDVRDSFGQIVTHDKIMFMEIERYWSTLTPEEKSELFSVYEELELLANEPPEVIREHVPTLVARIAKFHHADRFRQLYPHGSVWIPQNVHETYEEMSSNYPKEMTYIVQDYYELVILSLMTKPFIPVFLILDAFPATRASVESKRKSVYNLTYCMELLSDTEIATLSAITKLREFLVSVISKVQDGGSKGPNTANLTVLASICGYGTDMVEEYIIAFAVIRLIAMKLIGAELPPGTMVENNIVAGMYFNIRQEIETGFAGKISGQNVMLKANPEKIMFNGEKGKTSSIDLVQARTKAPMKEFVRTQEFFNDYRRAVRALNLDIAPADVKVLIDSININHQYPFYELYEWLVAAVMHRFADRRTYKEIDSEAFKNAMGISQAVYIYYGMPEIAQLLSCEMIRAPLNGGYPIEPIDNEIKIKTDRYYPQAYRKHRNTYEQSTLKDSLSLLVREHIAPFNFNLRATPEAARMLRCGTVMLDYSPHPRLQNMLAEFLLIQNRKKCEEVAWFNQ